jgi:hypothetical protein
MAALKPRRVVSADPAGPVNASRPSAASSRSVSGAAPA